MPPIPSPKKGESTEAFTTRCMDDEGMNAEYPDSKQRYAICMSQLEEAGRKTPKKKGK